MIGPAIVTRATSGPLPAANCTGRLSKIDLYGILSMTTSMSGLSFMNRADSSSVASHSLPSE